MIFVCCTSALHMPKKTLTYGETVDLPEVEAEELVLADKPLAPYDRINFEIDGSDEMIRNLSKAHHEYQSLLVAKAEAETAKKKETN